MNFSDLLPHPEIEIYFGHLGKPLVSVLSAVFHVLAIFSIVPLAKNVETIARLNLSVLARMCCCRPKARNGYMIAKMAKRVKSKRGMGFF